MSRRRKLLAVLALLACVLALWLLLRERPEPPKVARSDEMRDRAVPTPPRLSGPETATVPEPPPAALSSERPDPAEARAQGVRTAPRVAGTVRYEDGTVPHEFGFTLFRPTGPGTGGGWPIEGTEGTFEGPSARQGTYEIRHFRADGGEPAVVTPSVTYVRGTPLEIVLKRVASVRLRVVDAESGRVLPDARAYRDLGSMRVPPIDKSAEVWLPGDGTLRAPPLSADGAGVIVLPPIAEIAHWMVGAPDHAWQRLAVPAFAKDAITARLAAGGTAVVKVPDLARVTAPVLIVDRRAELPERIITLGAPAQADEAGTFRLEGLPEGLLTFAVGRRSAAITVAKVYATGQVDIRRGTEAHLTLVLDLGPPPKMVVLRGTLQIPAVWGRSVQPWQVFLTGAPDDARTAGHHAGARLAPAASARPTSFETEALPEGEYVLLLKPLYWRHRVIVREDMPPLEIVVPPPVQFRVRVVDAATGGDIPGAHLQYVPAIDPTFGWRWHDGRVDRETGEHVFRCPVSKVRLRATAPGYQARTNDIEPGDVGETSYVVELSAAGSLRLLFRHRGEPVSADGVQIWVSSPALGRGATGRGDVLEVDGLAPGEWTVKVKKIAGYRLPPLHTVFVEEGKATTFTIDLEAADD